MFQGEGSLSKTIDLTFQSHQQVCRVNMLYFINTFPESSTFTCTALLFGVLTFSQRKNLRVALNNL